MKWKWNVVRNESTKEINYVSSSEVQWREVDSLKIYGLRQDWTSFLSVYRSGSLKYFNLQMILNGEPVFLSIVPRSYESIDTSLRSL